MAIPDDSDHCDGESGAAGATFDRQVAELIPAMLRLAVRLCGDAHAAEDVVQDALVRAARSSQTFRGEAKLSTWLTRIVVNVFRDQVECSARRRDRDELTDDVEVDARVMKSSSDPARAAQADEFGRIVAKLVSQLPPRQREVLVLIAYEGLSGRTAAGVLGISEQNVRTTLHLAREKMKQMLAPCMNEGK